MESTSKHLVDKLEGILVWSLYKPTPNGEMVAGYVYVSDDENAAGIHIVEESKPLAKTDFEFWHDAAVASGTEVPENVLALLQELSI